MARLGQYVETVDLPNGKYAKVSDIVAFIMRIELDPEISDQARLALRLIREAIDKMDV